MTVGNYAPVRVDRTLILEKCSTFVDFQLWPVGAVNDPSHWLGNFHEDELDHAHHLLNAFMYYSERLVEQLFAAAFQNLSVRHRQDGQGFQAAQVSWERFCKALLLTYVTGENPNPTDSGFAFARMARQILRIEEDRILPPEDALRRLALEPHRPVVFVDDFVGSGKQFSTTWRRLYTTSTHGQYSFTMHADAHPEGSFFYCPALCTAYGVRNISALCRGKVILSFGNLLPDENSALHELSLVWPEHLRATGPAFIEAASRRAGIPDNGGNVNDWRGFHKLGLTLAFFHSTPDATLPLFYWEENGWLPLVKRR